MSLPEARTLEGELAALRERLEEAEEMRRAICAGEVDAFVVGPRDEDKQVLFLASAYSRYRELLESAEHGAVTVGAGGEILFANPRFTRIVGRAAGGLAPRSVLHECVHAEDRPALAALLGARRPGEVALRIVQPGGAQVPVRFALASAAEDHATLVVTDLSQLQAAQEARETIEAIRRGEVDAFVMGETIIALGGAHDPYRLLADRIQQGALMLSSGGGILYANARLARMLGVRADGLLGVPFAGCVLAEDRAALGQVLSRRNGPQAQAEVRLRRATGESLLVRVSAAALADGRQLCLVTDLSEAKRHKAADERTRKFLGILAHEFRGMLQTMRLSLDVLRRHDLDAECRKALDSTERQVRRMAEVVDDLRSINPGD